MTPEELLAIEGVDQEGLEKIGAAVNGYYGQYDQAPEPEPEPEPEPASEVAVESNQGPDAGSETVEAAATSEEESPKEGPGDTDLPAESIEAAEGESATIKNAETEPIS